LNHNHLLHVYVNVDITGKPIAFSDVDPSDKIDEYRRQKVHTFETERSTFDMGFQSAASAQEMSTQTIW